MSASARTDPPGPSIARHAPFQLLLVSADAGMAEATASVAHTLGMASGQARDTIEAVHAIASGLVELVIVDADLGVDCTATLVARFRSGPEADWAPLIVACRESHQRQALLARSPGLVDRTIVKPLLHDELLDSLAAARRMASLRRTLQNALDQVSEAVVVTDGDGRIRTCNSAAERCFQWKRQELLGANVSRLVPEHQRQEHDGHIARFHSTGKARSLGTGRFDAGQRRDGSRFGMHITVTDIGDASGTRFVGVVRALAPDADDAHLNGRAWRDALTGLATSSQAMDQLQQACTAVMAQAGQGNAALAVVCLDIDQLKSLNAAHGHAIGDLVIKALAQRLRHGLGEQDLVARREGGGFLVLLRGIRRAVHAEVAVQRMRSSLTQPVAAGPRMVAVDISAGLAVHGVDGTTPQQLLDAAGQALQAQKQKKRQAPGVGSDPGGRP